MVTVSEDGKDAEEEAFVALDDDDLDGLDEDEVNEDIFCDMWV